jgi:hypothetical protein
MMKTIQITIQEIWAASKHKVHKSKKTYNRKDKTKVIKDHERINN